MRKSKGHWYIRFQVDGVQYSSPTGLEASARNERKARQMEEAYRAKVLEGRSGAFRLKAKPFNEAAVDFIEWCKGEHSATPNTWKRVRASMTSAMVWFQDRSVSAITQGHVEGYKTDRRRMNVKEVTLRNDLHNLSKFFRWAMKHEYCRDNLIGGDKVRTPRNVDAVRMNVLTADQEALYFGTCLRLHREVMAARPLGMKEQDRHGYQDLHDFGRLMLDQGCRPEELIELQKRNVNLLTGHLRITSGKSKAAKRRLRISAVSAAILARRMETPGPWVFPSPRDSSKHRGPHWRMHEEVLKVTGLAFVPYDFRHTFATRAAASNMNISTLAAILGHSNLRSIQCYVHTSAETMDAEMERLEMVTSFLPVTNREDGEQTVSGSNDQVKRKGSRNV